MHTYLDIPPQMCSIGLGLDGLGGRQGSSCLWSVHQTNRQQFGIDGIAHCLDVGTRGEQLVDVIYQHVPVLFSGEGRWQMY